MPHQLPIDVIHYSSLRSTWIIIGGNNLVAQRGQGPRIGIAQELPLASLRAMAANHRHRTGKHPTQPELTARHAAIDFRPAHRPLCSRPIETSVCVSNHKPAPIKTKATPNWDGLGRSFYGRLANRLARSQRALSPWTVARLPPTRNPAVDIRIAPRSIL